MMMVSLIPFQQLGLTTVGFPTSGRAIIENENQPDDLHEHIPIVNLQCKYLSFTSPSVFFLYFVYHLIKHSVN